MKSGLKLITSPRLFEVGVKTVTLPRLFEVGVKQKNIIKTVTLPRLLEVGVKQKNIMQVLYQGSLKSALKRILYRGFEYFHGTTS